MAAEPLPAPLAEPLPSWVIPPHDGFTAEDFFDLRGLPAHTELIDGSLVFMSPQRMWHSWVVNLFQSELDRQAPDRLRAAREMAVKLGLHQVPEPDVVVVTAEAHDRDPLATHFGSDDVVMVVEAVSPDSLERDRDTKPRKYGAAGITHFWRVENEDDRAVVYTYQLDPASGVYAVTGIHHDRLKTTVPFDLDIDLTAVGTKPQ
ncbi:Uma2 family endonuclease [Haloactinopolyspora alba]|uniref:Uma2 family endonuclease n=1 Tax=Haloactinopolyspora alba TaxID=648780 RepID=A0A2P8DPH8_9ACTN|nr:Uma2 family endonuclease [Haloactinopolyspora alba]PSK99112.1 Uma2 family endonuclease [Haloactinopolyspora alba]